MVEIVWRLKNSRYSVDKEAHIKVDYQKCHACGHQACLTACPAQCYLAQGGREVVFNYENCLECGTCSLICDQGALQWEYPRGGYGISFRFA